MTNDPTSAAYEAQLKIKRDLQLLKGEDDQYVLSTFASMYALPKLVEYIEQALAEAETRGRMQNKLEVLRWKSKYLNEKIKRTKIYLGGDETAKPIIAQKQRVNKQIASMKAELQANADGANGRDGEVTNNG